MSEIRLGRFQLIIVDSTNQFQLRHDGREIAIDPHGTKEAKTIIRLMEAYIKLVEEHRGQE
jgi:hypothetical protein